MSFFLTYQPRVEDFDHNGNLSLEATLQMFENAGVMHSATVGDMVIDNSLAGTSWIVAEWRVEIYAQPSSRTEKLTVETYPWGRTPASIVYRDYTLRDSAGNVLAKGSAKLGLLDLARGRLIRVTSEYHDRYNPGDSSVFETQLPRMREMQPYSDKTQLVMRRGDMDFNGHVHNTFYLRYALEALPQEEYARGAFRSFRISFHKPIEKLQTVTVCSSKGEGGIYNMAIYDEAGVLQTLVDIGVKE